MDAHRPSQPGRVPTIQSMARMVRSSPVFKALAGQMRARPTLAKSQRTKGISASNGNWECTKEPTPVRWAM